MADDVQQYASIFGHHLGKPMKGNLSFNRKLYGPKITKKPT